MRFQFRLLLESCFLTVLIWTYADQASYEDSSAVVAVKVAAPPEVMAKIDGARSGPTDVVYIPVKLRGPKAAIRKLEMEKSEGSAPPFTLDIPVTGDLEMRVPHTRDIRDDVARLPAIRNNGLQVEEISRQTVVFTLDRYKTLSLVVDTDAGRFTEALESKPDIDPKQVAVRVLEGELEQRGNLGTRLVIPIEDRLRSGGDAGEFAFPVTLGTKWEGLDATFQPNQVRVTVRLARRYDSAHLTLIPLRPLWPPGTTASDYQIELQNEADKLVDVDVRVPIGKSTTLASNDVIALIDIEESDLPEKLAPAATAPAATGGWSQREVRFVFPPGFEDVQVSGLPQQIKFRIAKRVAASDLPLNPIP